jgi:hypothetical protein
MIMEDITKTVKEWLSIGYCYGGKWEKRYCDERDDEVEVVAYINIVICGKLLRVSLSQNAFNTESDIKETVERMDKILQGIEGDYMKILE